MSIAYRLADLQVTPQQNDDEIYLSRILNFVSVYFLAILKSVSFKKTVEISRTHEICTEFTQSLIKTKQI